MDERLTHQVPRRIEATLARASNQNPVVALHGPRSVGKSTVLQRFAAARGAAVIDLDDRAVRDAVRSSPTLAVSGATPICIDEYQHVPEVLDALKARLNAEGSRPGTAVLTGSTRHDALPRTAQALTGRLHVLEIRPLSQGEIATTREDLVAGVLRDPVDSVAAHPSSRTTRSEYAARVCAGGLPMALHRVAGRRAQWFDDYIRLSIERDAAELIRVQQRDVLRRLLDRLVGQTGQVLNLERAGGELGIERKTLEGYARLLEDLFLIEQLPAWGTTLRARAASRPKIHAVDAGLAARLLRLTPSKFASLDPAALTEFGHLLETFVVGELRKQVSWLDEPLAVGHWRTRDGDEIDFVIENDDGGVICFEVKAAERITERDLKGLRKLRGALGDRFMAGIALSLGQRSYHLEDRLHVMPIDRIWRPIAS